MAAWRWASVFVLVGLFLPAPARAALKDPTFSESAFATSAQSLTGIAWAPDGSNRLFYTQKVGAVRIIEGGELLPTPFASFPQTYAQGECGAVGIAFDPAFLDNGYVYVFVTVSATEQQIIRLTADGNIGTDPTVIVGGLPTRGVNHNGGAIGFGPDGKLYWAIGDNGNGTGVDADLALLASKVGRANPDGSVPNDNPFFDGPGPNNDYIWARGFRNPFTMTWSPRREELWLNVVGTAQEQVFVVKSRDHAGYNDYESNQPSGYLTPVISYPTNSTSPKALTANGAVRSGGIATFTTVTPHRFRPGAQITVSGVADASFNGYSFVKDVPDATHFTFVQPGPDAESGSGSASSQFYGSAILGGVFWDSSSVPPNRRGFYFGDYTYGNLMRASLDAADNVLAVEAWGSGHKGYIDSDIGPDGNLYLARLGGSVFRLSYTATSQGLVVSRLHHRMPEGSSAAFGVRLAQAPGGTINIGVARVSGDLDVAVASGNAVTFDATDWSTPKIVRLSAVHDDDSVDDVATFAVTSPGLATQLVLARVTDEDVLSILTSTSNLALTEGSSIKLQVRLGGPPAGPVQVVVTSAGDGDVSASSILTFDTSNWSENQPVTVAAAEDADLTDDEATLTLSAAGISGSREVEVTVDDNDESAPTVQSEPLLTAVVGAEYQYDAEADGNPLPSYSLDTAPNGMSIDAGSGLVIWTPTQTGSVDVALRVSNGIEPDALQAFVIQVLDDMPPTCKLTAPMEGDVLSGTMAEFFGDVMDDVGAVGASFWVDAQNGFDDVNTGGHYHFGGTHNLFDTTQYGNGSHVLGMTGTDTSGQTCSVEVNVTIDNPSSGEGGATGDAGAPSTGSAGTLNEAGASGGSGGSAGETDEGPGGAPFGDGPTAGQSSDPSSAREGQTDNGCSCRLASGSERSPFTFVAALVLGLRWRRHEQRRRSGAQRTSISLV